MPNDPELRHPRSSTSSTLANRTAPRKRPCWIVTGGLALLSVAQPSLAQEHDIDLGSTTIKGQAMAQHRSQAYSNTRLHNDEIRDARVDQVQQMFERIPGMNVRNLGLPGVADNISLRGFGNGGHGGDIGFVLDGIPLNEAMSHADGYGDLNIVIPLELEQIDVLRGPVSALYGNYNRAGNIVLQTRRGGHYRDIDISAAEHGKFDMQAAAGFRNGDNQRFNLAAQAVHDEGFREQSRAERQTLAGRWAIDATPELEIALSARLHEGEADNPSYLPYAQFKQRPYSVYSEVQNDGAEKSFRSLRLDANYRLSSDLKLLSFIYNTRQDFTRWFTRPVADIWTQREEAYDRNVIGGGFNLNGQSMLADSPLNWVTGVEAYRERTDYQKHEGTQFRQPVGLPELDRRFRLNNLAVFGELEWQLHRLITPTLGWRWDRFTGDCEQRGAQTSSSACERMASVTHASPKLGIRSQLRDWLQLRASWAEGFAIAPETAKYSLQSSDLSTNVFRQYEVGARLDWQHLELDLSAYRMDSSDEIGMTPAGEYENFGETRRTGIEVAGRWYLTDTLDLALAWATANSSIRQHHNADLIGNRVVGVPSHTTTFTANWRPTPTWEGTLSIRDLGDYAVDANNRQSDGGYRVTDLSVSYLPRNAPGYRPYLAIENLTDRVYATTVSTLGYAAGAPRRISVGLQASF